MWRWAVRGVESIIGAYLAILLIVGVVVSLHIYLSRVVSSTSNVLNNNLYDHMLILNSPILSLRYVDGDVYRLQIIPLLPFHLDYIIVKSVDSEILYQDTISMLIDRVVEIEIVLPRTPAIIELVTSNGLVFFYNPRNDPNLATAPESVRSKSIIDEELSNYLKNKLVSNSSSTIEVLHHIGYKLLAGRTHDPGGLSRGPIACVFDANDPYAPCNVFIHRLAQGNGYPLSFLTYNYNLTHWWFDESSRLNLNLSLPGYADFSGVAAYFYFWQVTRLVRAVGSSVNISFYVEFELVNCTSTTGHLAVVAYALPANTPLHYAIALSYPELGTTPWLRRLVLASYPLSNLVVNSTREGWTTYYVFYHNGTYNLLISPSELGVNEFIVVYGVELVHYRSTQSLKVKVEPISIEPAK